MNKILNKMIFSILFFTASQLISGDFGFLSKGMQPPSCLFEGNADFLRNNTDITPIVNGTVPLVLLQQINILEIIKSCWGGFKDMSDECKKCFLYLVSTIQDQLKKMKLPRISGRNLNISDLSGGQVLKDSFVNDYLNGSGSDNLDEAWNKFYGAVRSTVAKGLNSTLKVADIAKGRIPSFIKFSYKNPAKAILAAFSIYITFLVAKRLVTEVPGKIADKIVDGIFASFSKTGSLLGRLIGFGKKDENNNEDSDDYDKRSKKNSRDRRIILHEDRNIVIEDGTAYY